MHIPAEKASTSVPAGTVRGYALCEGSLRDIRDVDGARSAHEVPGAIVWVDVVDPATPLLYELSRIFGLHPLIVENVAERNQRGKIERTAGQLHVVAFALRYAARLERCEIDLVLGHGYLLSVHEPAWDPFGADVVRRDPTAMLAPGADHALWALTDALVDSYFPVFDRLGDEIERLQDEVMGRPGRGVVERLLLLRRDLLIARHVVNPQREIFNQLTNREESLIDPDRLIYFRDVYDHLIRLTDELDSYRELASATLDVYLSTINNNLSDVMKRLTAVTVILAGIGAAAGIFGMSEAGRAFDLGEGSGFWILTLAMLLAGAAAWLYFRRIDWL